MGLSNNANANECIMALSKFVEALNDVSEDINQVSRHLNSLEQEISGEAQAMASVLQNEIVPVMSEGSASEQQKAKLIKDEEVLASNADKISQDLESEISEIKSFIHEIDELDRKAKDAKKALHILEKIEKGNKTFV